MDNVQDELGRMWAKGVFEPSLLYIRFPVFKNLSTNFRIDLTHPVTAIVGPNGCNKTAILRALQGCPTGNDLGNYWFGTAMDDIAPETRHRFIYGRYSATAERVIEVVKTRIGRRRSSRSKKEIDPDLFEPSRPLMSPPDGMEKYSIQGDPPRDGSKTRWNTIDKEVLYLDFRSQLSAFDWAFHHAEIGRAGVTALQTLRQRKAAIRRRSRRLAGAIQEGKESDVWYGAERIIEPIHDVSDFELNSIQEILGREYESIRLIHHRYFGRQGGWTVLMKTAGVQYSEAFAGSGEYAAVMLVRSVTRARPKSLILLDEPEVSLHPAAQRGVVAFLSDAARRWHHQVVFATHAPEMVRGLPVNAIKVLTVRADDGRVDIPTQDVAAYAAFDAVGASYDRPTVVVEDRLAEVLVKRAIQNLPIAGSVDVRFVPGGAETLWAHYMPMWAHDDRTSLLLLLDGDQRAEAPPPSANVGPNDLEVVLVESMKGIEPKLPYGASEANSQENREKSLRKVLDWRRLFVDFLSVRTPEEFLLRNFAARENYELPDGEKLDSKVEWHKIAASELDRDASGDEIFVFQQAELSKVSLEDESMTAIAMSVQNFVEGLVP